MGSIAEIERAGYCVRGFHGGFEENLASRQGAGKS